MYRGGWVAATYQHESKLTPVLLLLLRLVYFQFRSQRSQTFKQSALRRTIFSTRETSTMDILEFSMWFLIYEFSVIMLFKFHQRVSGFTLTINLMVGGGLRGHKLWTWKLTFNRVPLMSFFLMNQRQWHMYVFIYLSIRPLNC